MKGVILNLQVVRVNPFSCRVWIFLIPLVMCFFCDWIYIKMVIFMEEYGLNDVLGRLHQLKGMVEDETDVYIIEDLIFLIGSCDGMVDVSVVMDIMDDAVLDE